jgi:uncharacterized membrane protein
MRLVRVLALILWALLAFLTMYVLFTSGPGVLELSGILVVAVLGVGVFGALGDSPRRGGPL